MNYILLKNAFMSIDYALARFDIVIETDLCQIWHPNTIGYNSVRLQKWVLPGDGCLSSECVSFEMRIWKIKP